jgi:hypothetical protein
MCVQFILRFYCCSYTKYLLMTVWFGHKDAIGLMMLLSVIWNKMGSLYVHRMARANNRYHVFNSI